MYDEKLLGINSKGFDNRRGYTKVFSNICFTTKSVDDYIYDRHINGWSLFYLCGETIETIYYEILDSELFQDFLKETGKDKLKPKKSIDYLLNIIPRDLQFSHKGESYVLIPQRWFYGTPTVDNPNTQIVFSFFDKHMCEGGVPDFWVNQITKIINNPNNVFKANLLNIRDAITDSIIKYC